MATMTPTPKPVIPLNRNIMVGGVSEAPIDGDQYARKNAGWEKVVSTGGGSILLATEYDLSAVDGILICSQYNPNA